jgi:hypothetical protein
MKFIEYLHEKFFGIKNIFYDEEEFEVAFDEWVADLDYEEIVEYAEKWHELESI